jgi:hypothetical protein
MVRGAVARVWHRHLFSLAVRAIATDRFTTTKNVADTRVPCAVLFVVFFNAVVSRLILRFHFVSSLLKQSATFSRRASGRYHASFRDRRQHDLLA